ncbi:MAG: lipocalin family protein [Amaricoccus sp.]
MRLPILVAATFALAACAPSYRDATTPIAAQRDVAPERYLGRWYEIARFPVIFERGCTATTADYGAIDARTISVLNTCRKDNPDGPAESIAGTATIVAPGELKVRFASVPFVAADYWVLWVDKDYQTAAVGVPSGRAGWILARTPTIDPQRRAEAEAALARNGYDTTKLYDVPQSPAAR